MTGDSITERVVHQLLVPAYVWNDPPQRNAACVAIGAAMRRMSGDDVDIDNATVSPQGLRAVVSHVQLDESSDPVGFVGYDTCKLDEADLVMISVDAAVLS